MMSCYLIEALGIDPYNNELNPRYNPRTPWPLTVLTTQSIGPLYLGVADFSSSCIWVLTYSVGNVQHISRPPAIPPFKRHKLLLTTLKGNLYVCLVILSTVLETVAFWLQELLPDEDLQLAVEMLQFPQRLIALWEKWISILLF